MAKKPDSIFSDLLDSVITQIVNDYLLSTNLVRARGLAMAMRSSVMHDNLNLVNAIEVRDLIQASAKFDTSLNSSPLIKMAQRAGLLGL